ncbi:MAG: AAA family ATPase [Proteobacteria bacterium]|nr:AAA family ATPase [Pseudomonadota bacterium]
MPPGSVVADDLRRLLDLLPDRIRERLLEDPEIGSFLEVILDLGRLPEARFVGREVILSDDEVTAGDIEAVVTRIGAFGDDNRAGIPRTLHRISAIRNRRGDIVGLTCRAGRAVMGTVDVIRDLVESGRSILILGRPGVGKTTILRETARVLADDLRKRVVIVDTSNEIAGDGDIPHPGIGRARRMQVPTPSQQHAVMIEAVENHMPEVIVIDEIGTALETEAARTIAERGVQLVATAHGTSLDNLLVNPTLTDLVGGIQTVTLGDDEARRRGTQKTILERKAPPTFDVLVEMQDRQRLIVHRDVTETVDGLLRGQPVLIEARSRREDGTIERRAEVTTRGAGDDRRRGPAPEGFGAYGGPSPRPDSGRVIRLTAWNRAIQPLHPWDERCRPRGWPLLPAQRDLLTHLTTDGRCALAGGLSPVHLIRPIRRRCGNGPRQSPRMTTPMTMPKRSMAPPVKAVLTLADDWQCRRRAGRCVSFRSV